MKKDCSYLSFEEELEMGEYLMEEADEIKYQKEILEEMKDINKELNSTYNNINGSTFKVLNSLQQLSRSNCNKLRKNGTYQLHGIVIHSGSSTGGHYHTFIRKYEDDDDFFNKGDSSSSSTINNLFPIMNNPMEWWNFDDAKVKEVNWGMYEKKN
jgi:hypothetical protein